jgi:hypothetical protein
MPKKFRIRTKLFFYKLLEITPCGLGSTIRDKEAEWRLKVITDHQFLIESLVSRIGTVG